MFLTEIDYKTLIIPDDLDMVEQSDSESRLRAEAWAVEQMSGYLRSRFDLAAAFAEWDIVADPPIDDPRNKSLVMYCIDITLYHLHASIPGRFVPEIRIRRYEDALIWLKDVAKGIVDPGLPGATGTETGGTSGPIIYGGNERNNMSW